MEERSSASAVVGATRNEIFGKVVKVVRAPCGWVFLYFPPSLRGFCTTRKKTTRMRCKSHLVADVW